METPLAVRVRMFPGRLNWGGNIHSECGQCHPSEWAKYQHSPFPASWMWRPSDLRPCPLLPFHPEVAPPLAAPSTRKYLPKYQNLSQNKYLSCFVQEQITNTLVFPSCTSNPCFSHLWNGVINSSPTYYSQAVTGNRHIQDTVPCYCSVPISTTDIVVFCHGYTFVLR
jgi:hypothetical protein